MKWYTLTRGHDIPLSPANTRRCPDVGPMLGQRRRQWPSDGTTSRVCWEVINSSHELIQYYNFDREIVITHQRSTLTVVRWSETPRNHVGPPEHSNPVVQWTTKIFSSKQSRNMAKKSKKHGTALAPFHGTKQVFNIIMLGMNY